MATDLGLPPLKEDDGIEDFAKQGQPGTHSAAAPAAAAAAGGATGITHRSAAAGATGTTSHVSLSPLEAPVPDPDAPTFPSKLFSAGVCLHGSVMSSKEPSEVETVADLETAVHHAEETIEELKHARDELLKGA